MAGYAIPLVAPPALPPRLFPELGELGRVDLDEVARLPGVESVDFFRPIAKHLADVAGFRCWMPCFYYDASAISAVFTADAEAVARLLPSPRLRPLLVARRAAVIVFTAFEYRVTDIGPYNEFAISVPVRLGAGPNPPVLPLLWQMLRRDVHAYVWQLPVTTEIARLGGVEVYNYPKFLADLPFERAGGEVRTAIVRDGRTDIALTGKELPTKRARTGVQHAHSVMDGRVMDAAVRANPIARGSSRAPFAARLHLGDGPIADRLRQVGIGRLVAYDYTPKLQLILPAAEPVA